MSLFRSVSRAALSALVFSVACSSLAVHAQTVFTETFGTSSIRTASPYVAQEYLPGTGVDDSGLPPFSHGQHYYRFADPAYVECPGGNSWESCMWNSRTIDNGYYAVVRPASVYDEVGSLPGYPGWANWWNTSIQDHTGDNGAVLVVNAGTIRNDFYRRTVPLVPGGIYRVSAWRHVSSAPVSMRFEVQNTYTSEVLTNSPAYATWGTGGWTQYSWDFTIPAACSGGAHFAVALRNMQSTNQGNDFYIDDIVLQKIGDDPAAPAGGFECPQPADPRADVHVSKELVDPAAVPSGQMATFQIVVGNHGPDAADGAMVSDPAVAGLDCLDPAAGLVCTSGGGATCPGVASIAALQGSPGLVIPVLPVNGTVAFSLTCRVTATGQ